MIFFVVVAVWVVVAIWFYIRLRFLFFCRLAAEKSLKRPQKATTFFFYSSWAVKQECISQFFHLPRAKETTAALLLMQNFNKGKSHLSRLIKAEPHHYRFKLLLAEAEWTAGQTDVMRRLIDDIKLPFFALSYWKALFFHLSSLSALYNTDMMTASQYASKALKLYQKNGFALEEARVYMTLSHIYRISGVFDTATTMLSEALKLYQFLGIPLGEVEVLAYFGVIEMMRENYMVADSYFQEAASLAKKNKLVHLWADIENRLGLNAYLNKNYKQALEYFKRSCSEKNSTRAKVFAFEMLSRIMLQDKKYAAARRYVQQALSYPQEQGEKFENLYLLAEIHFQVGELQKSRQILTELIKQKYSPSAIWYPANAYTLLGLIDLKENNLQQAKNRFKQALDLEHGRHRLKGAAIDYNNLAEICYLEGHAEEASRYLEQALSYAEEIGDEELQSYLKVKFPN